MDNHTLHASLLPITATAITKDHYLVGEGTHVQIYERASLKHVIKQKILNDQVVHGFAHCLIPSYACEVYAWGGRQIRKITIAKSESTDSIQLGSVNVISDWILQVVSFNSGESLGFEVLLLTAHNVLLGLRKVIKDGQNGVVTEELTYGPRSLLYTADLLILSKNLVGVAAGTANGKIIIWSYSLASCEENSIKVHYVFSSHQGSVFGLRFAQNRCITRIDPRLQPYLVSCSDDRSIKIWDVRKLHEHTGKNSSTSNNSEMLKATVATNENLLASTTGHASRIWDAIFVEIEPFHLNVLSIGEDATTQLWNFLPRPTDDCKDGTRYTLEHKQGFAFNSKRNLWCIAVSSATLTGEVLVGGADGKILKYSIKASHSLNNNEWQILTNERLRNFGESLNSADFLRDYDFLDVNTLIGITNNGIILTASIQKEGKDGESWPCWFEVGQNESLVTYSRIKCIREVGRAVIVGASGPLYIYDHALRRLFNLMTVDTKTGDIFIQNRDVYHFSFVMTKVGSNVIHFLTVRLAPTEDPELLHTSLIHLPFSFIVASAACAVSENHVSHLFLGGRDGSILVISLKNFESGGGEVLSLVQLNNIHQGESVTALLLENESKGLVQGQNFEHGTGFNWLFSTGRDGNIAVLKFNGSYDTNTVELTHRNGFAFGPHVEGLYKDPTSGLLFVYGFRGTEFVIYNEHLDQEIVTVECGGAHRKWSFFPFTATNPGRFAWTKSSVLHLRSVSNQSHEIIRSGGHGREIKALAIFPHSSGNEFHMPLIATGAEDTEIRLFAYDEEKQPHLKCLTVIREHVTGIQQLQWCPEGKYLFSSGGFQEFFIWRVQKVPTVSVGVMRESACPVKASNMELRIMGFSVRSLETNTDIGQSRNRLTYLIMMAYSDSAIHIYRYRPDGCNWTWLQQTSYRCCCLTQLSIIPSVEQDLLLGSATNGRLAFWSFQANAQNEMNKSSTSPGANISLGHMVDAGKIHENGIVCLEYCLVDSYSYLLATGGDDGTLAFSLLDASDPNLPTITSKVRICGAHAASLSALTIWKRKETITATSDRKLLFSVFSCGKDQRLKLWEFAVDVTRQGAEGVEVTCVANVFSPVADVSSLAILRRDNGLFSSIVAAGTGLNIWRFIDLA